MAFFMNKILSNRVLLGVTIQSAQQVRHNLEALSFNESVKTEKGRRNHLMTALSNNLFQCNHLIKRSLTKNLWLHHLIMRPLGPGGALII